MKAISAAIAGTLLLGVGSLMYSTPSAAAPTCRTCDAWYAQCQANPGSSACVSWDTYCGHCPVPSVMGAPPAKGGQNVNVLVLLNNAEQTPALVVAAK